MVHLQIISKVLKSGDPTIIINNDLTAEQFIGYEDYYDFIMDHYRRYGNVPDIATFLDNFQDFELLDVAESDKYLVDKIQEEYLYAKMVPILQTCASMLTNQSSIEALDYLKGEIINMTPGGSTYGVNIIKDARLRYEEHVQKRDSEDPWMYSTGFPELDDKIGGLALGEEFVVIVARTNQGKSWILTEMATHIWGLGCNVGYISPEMSSNAIGYRFDTLYAHFSNSDLFRGVPVTNYEDYITDLSNNSDHDFIVATPADFNKRITISKLRNFCLQCNLNLLCIDGITYLADERYKRGDNKTTSLTNISEDLMELSLELKIPIITVVQANRSAVEMDEGVPELESIRDSDGIAYNASKVISIRQHGENLHMEIKKNRNGPVNVRFSYRWDIDHGTFDYNVRDGEYSESTSSSSHYSTSSSSNNSNSVNPANSRPPVKARKGAVDIFS